MNYSKIVFCIAVCASCFLLISAQSFKMGWLDDLRVQLQIEKECKVEYFMQVRETQEGTVSTYSARAACWDGRIFEAIRVDPEFEFKIEPCGVSLCRLE